jgi:hypothetical protein
MLFRRNERLRIMQCRPMSALMKTIHTYTDIHLTITTIVTWSINLLK